MASSERSVTRTIARNTAFIIAANFTLRIVGVIFNVFIVRQLGDSGFGNYSVVIAWTGLFSVLGDMGIAQYMAREIARDREKALSLFWDVTALRFILAIITAVVTTGTAIAQGYERDVVIAIAIVTSGYLFQAVLAPLNGTIAGHERLDILSVMAIVGQVIFMAAAALFLLAGYNFVWVSVASLFNMPLLIGFNIWVVRRYRMSPPPFQLHRDFWLKLLWAGLPFAMIQVTLTFAYRIDTIILESNFGAQVVGWYNAPYQLARSLLFVTAAFSVALVPTLAHEHATDPERVRPWYYRSVRFLLFIGLPLAVGGTLLSDKIIPYLYGDEFAPSSIAFAILIWDSILLMYTSLGGNLTSVIRKERRAALIYGSEAAINLVLNLLLIPLFGIIAASFNTVATELTGALLFYLLFRREFGAGLNLKHSLRLVLCAAIMGIVVYLMRDVNPLIVIPCGATVYLGAVWLTNALNQEEREIIVKLVTRMTGRVARLRSVT